MRLRHELALCLPSTVGALALFVGIAASSAGEPAIAPLTASELAARIDAHIDEVLIRKQIKPAAPADDAEFFRRLTLDLNGRIPTVAEAREFLADADPQKRRRAIESRLADPLYVRHLTNTWRSLLLAQANPQDVRYLAPKIETWLAHQLRRNVPYDVWVRELLTTPLDVRPTSRLERFHDDTSAHAVAFFQANELKPENLAAATSRVFLGVNLDCAQCHNHPFADWKQQQFWQLAAFYAGVGRVRPDNAFMAAPEMTDRRELAVAGTTQIVQATFLDGTAPEWKSQSSPRVALAAWLTTPGNSYFARAAANRVWAHLFGRGLVEPLDGLGGREAPSHPELLDELAAQLVAHDFDLKFLLQALAQTEAYGRTSRATDPSHRDATNFARMPVRGITAEQVFDSLTTAVGYREPTGQDSKNLSPRADLLLRFASLDRPTETPTSITQALTLMNGRFIAEALDPEGSGTVAAVLTAPFLDEEGRIETLYLAALSRPPSVEELAEGRNFIQAATDDEPAAYADLFWALVNSGEFLLNH